MTTPRFTNSTDLARHAVTLAAKLTPAQRHALETGEPAHVRTYRNLRAADLVEHQGGPATYRPTVPTNLGRVVALVLKNGADAVLTTAGREDAALHVAVSRDIVISEGAATSAGTDDTATVAFRAALLDHLHGLAIAEYTRLEECRAALRQVGAELDGARLDLTPAALLETVERRVFGDAAVDAHNGPAEVEVYPSTTAPAGPRWIIPTEGTRLTDRHDVLGPYNTDELAERIRDRYRAEGIACEIVRSVSRPVLRTGELGAAAADRHDAVTAYRELSQSATAARHDPRLPDQDTREARYAAFMASAKTALADMPDELGDLLAAEHAALSATYRLVISDGPAEEIREQSERAKAVAAKIAAYLDPS